MLIENVLFQQNNATIIYTYVYIVETWVWLEKKNDKLPKVPFWITFHLRV